MSRRLPQAHSFFGTDGWKRLGTGNRMIYFLGGRARGNVFTRPRKVGWPHTVDWFASRVVKADGNAYRSDKAVACATEREAMDLVIAWAEEEAPAHA